MRSRESPLDCLPQRTRDEEIKCGIGTLLALRVFLILWDAVFHGAWGLFEHPRALGPPAPSLFHSEVMTDMLQMFSTSSIVTFDQCQCGSPARKPTGFWISHSRLFESPGYCSHKGGHQPAIGKSSSGSWKTTPLAQYPAALCLRIAQSTVRHALLREGRSLPGDLAVAGAVDSRSLAAASGRYWEPSWARRALSPAGVEGAILAGLRDKSQRLQN